MVYLGGCAAPKPIFRLSPTAQDTTWLFGQEYVKISTDSLEVAIAFNRAYEGYLVFDVEIANLSDHTFLASPAEFYYIPLKSLQDSLSRTQIAAIDPETRLLEIDKEMSRENAHHSSMVALDATISVLDLVADIVSIGQGESTDEVLNDNVHRTAERVERDQNHQFSITNLNAVRETWELETLRKTYLKPQHQIQGQVNFPVDVYAKYIEVYLPLSDYLISFTFRQDIHKAN